MTIKRMSSAIGALVGLTLSAQVFPAQDLMEIYELAVASDPALAAQRQALLATGELKAQARAVLLPNVELTADTTKNELRDLGSGSFSQDIVGAGRNQQFNSHGYTLSLRQPLFNWALFVGVKQAGAEIRQSEAQFTSAQQELILRTSESYFEVLEAQDNLAFARAEKAAIGRQLEQAKQRFEVGLIAITDIHEAQARYDLTTAQEIDAENRLTRSWEALRAITGQHHSDLEVLGAAFDPAMPEPTNIERWVEVSLEQNAALRAQQAAVDVAREQMNLIRTDHYPTVDVVGRHIFSSANASRFGSPSKTEDTTLSLELTVPIFQGGLVNSRTRQAAHLHAQAKDRLEETRRDLVRQSRVSYLNIASSISSVRALEQALVSTRSALDATELGFKVGTRTSVDVLDSQRELFRSQRELAGARYAYILNSLRLKQAAGTVGPDDLQAINAWLVDPDSAP